MFKNYVSKRQLEGTTVYSGFIRLMRGDQLIWSEGTGIFRLNRDDALADAKKLSGSHWLTQGQEGTQR